MPADEDAIIRRLEALERATEKRLDDARDIHRREHEAAEQAHDDVHSAHSALHEVEKEQRDQTRIALDRRLEGMNEIRAQLNTQALTFQTLAASQAAHDGMNARVDELRERMIERLTSLEKTLTDRIVNLEKGDVRDEGKSLGQGTVVAIIVGAVGFVGSVLGIIILLANIATSAH